MVAVQSGYDLTFEIEPEASKRRSRLRGRLVGQPGRVIVRGSLRVNVDPFTSSGEKLVMFLHHRFSCLSFTHSFSFRHGVVYCGLNR